MDHVKALILGLVEGITEFLPVSSTGHLILVGTALGLVGARAKAFEIFIQLGAILAIVWLYRTSLLATLRRGPHQRQSRRLLINLALGFLPAAAVGFLAHGWIKERLFSPMTVGIALVAGGIVILLIERKPRATAVQSLDELSPAAAFAIGCIQVLALIPGVSRSGATIMGGVAIGLSRVAATEFSFLLAIPVMFAATGFDLLSSRNALTRSDVSIFAVGFITAFLSALIVVRLFLRYVGGHTFAGFAWYRIIFGLLVLAMLAR